MNGTFQSKYEELNPEVISDVISEFISVNSSGRIVSSEKEVKSHDDREKYLFISGFGEPTMSLTDY